MRKALPRWSAQRYDYRANALRWHAFRDALRHNSAPHRMLKIGRGASRAALPRGAWER
ncbi:DUF1534 domain-containing protein [Pseudomonas syringae]|uniref:DUF1534 domain-containing protein n=1 Tax=Pseudomonas syringae TaxID=317 RepID=A0A9Q4A854_PSESX|nr:DUF1534 domain-containing protein [Pseudomonas syringae]MCF5473530.1 DUF1534 domain-containing protein [Pseudomonas syringae]MCF5483569.1 DUF1534 domain-containing protein [Pseudomonas syringae]MCF5488898.1 DUF1534 domain-containing protein [Pseudomonas syringae]MCF5493707.1 DUF1534 domain-containing protein [Pseudomonas syringae]